MKKCLVIIAFSLYLIFLGYLVFNPLVYLDFCQLIKPQQILNIEDAKDYYSFLSSVSGIILSILGLTLGYFYYINRKKIDLSTQKKEQQCRRLDAFISKLDKYDEFVHCIFALNVANAKDLKWIRANIEISFESIQTMLKEGRDLLGITKEDARAILRVNSFVDNNDMITRYPLSKLSASKLNSVKNEYIELMREARIICYRRIL